MLPPACSCGIVDSYTTAVAGGIVGAVNRELNWAVGVGNYGESQYTKATARF